MMRGAVTVGLAILSSFPTLAPARGDESAMQAFDLRVKPLLCVLDRFAHECDIAFFVSWESGKSGDFCLYNDFAAEPLACWRATAAGDYTDRRAVSDGFRYWMTREGANRELAAVAVDVLRPDSDDRRRRRRSRHVWDVL